MTFAIDAPADYRAADVRTGFAGSDFTFADAGRHVRRARPAAGALQRRSTRSAPGRRRARSARELDRAARDHAGCPAASSRSTEGQPFAVLVDYAHKPDSLENVLRAARELADGRVIVVFGAGGDRDRGKRPLMGEIGARLADVCARHVRQPALGGPGGDHRRDRRRDGRGRERAPSDPDRRAAIHRAIALAEPGDVVVIAGKGHEQGQEFAGGRKEPFDDVTVAREALRSVAAA